MSSFLDSPLLFLLLVYPRLNLKYKAGVDNNFVKSKFNCYFFYTPSMTGVSNEFRNWFYTRSYHYQDRGEGVRGNFGEHFDYANISLQEFRICKKAEIRVSLLRQTARMTTFKMSCRSWSLTQIRCGQPTKISMHSWNVCSETVITYNSHNL